MKLFSLGKSGLMVSPIGLGCWQFSKHQGLVGRYWPDMPDATIVDIVRRSIEGGVNWFDTAESYGNGASELALSESLIKLGKTGSDVIVATKWWPLFRTATSITATFPERQRCLRGLPISLYQVHQAFGFSRVEREMDAMASLYKKGLIRAIGVSNYSAKQMRRAHVRLAHNGIPLASNQVRYSLLDRRIEKNGILETARELGITVIAYSPLEQGVLTGRFRPESMDGKNLQGVRRHLPAFSPRNLQRIVPLLDLLAEISGRHNANPAQIALQWVVSAHGSSVVAIPGASTADQAESNAAAMKIELTQSELEALNEVSQRLSK